MSFLGSITDLSFPGVYADGKIYVDGGNTVSTETMNRKWLLTWRSTFQMATQHTIPNPSDNTSRE